MLRRKFVLVNILRVFHALHFRSAKSLAHSDLFGVCITSLAHSDAVSAFVISLDFQALFDAVFLASIVVLEFQVGIMLVTEFL